jgi:hypothetical protein
MNDSAIDTVHTKEDLWVSHTKKAFSSMTVEGIIGMGAVAATIIGLSNVAPELLASIACIAVGVALAFEGGAISARYSALHGMAEGNTNTDATARWGGMTTLFLAGAVGIALGILSLLGIVSMILLPAAAIVFGSALILDSGANARLSVLEARHSEEFKSREKIIKETAYASAGIELLVGIGSIVLGIVALNGVYPLVLILVAMLGIGAANLMTGAMIGGRMSSIFRY